ncbi:MAG: PKD domain-containing protein [Thermoplasmata archaeon]|nr:MAG: PKD domain-containing protein [Thermoplasmata archaeon]
MTVSENSDSAKKVVKVKKKVKMKKLKTEPFKVKDEESEKKVTEMVKKEETPTDEEDVVVITLGRPPEKEPEAEEPEEIEVEEGLESKGEEGVVVISLERPPEEPAAAEEEAFVEEEAVEAEVVEEETVKAPPKEEPKKRTVGAAVIVLIIILAAVVSSVAVYFVFLQNQDPKAALTLSPPSAMAGQQVVIDASNSTDDKGIVEYRWDFGDQSDIYKEDASSHQDGRFNGKTTHFYEEEGTYTVELQVRDEEGRTDTVSKGITVSELTVTIPAEKVGDEITYDVEGYVDLENSEGLYSAETGQGTVIIKRIHMDYTGFMETSSRSIVTQEDGFGDSHETLEKYNNLELDLSGDIYARIELKGGGTIDNQKISMSGDLTVTDSTYLDLDTNKSIFSDVVSDLMVTAGADLGVNSHDELRSYSNLREEPAVFRVEDLSADRTFSVGDQQTKIMGDVAYTWRVLSAGNVKGYPALEINVSVDDTTMTENNIEVLYISLWIANGIPFPVKTHIFVEIEDEGTTLIVLYDNVIRENSFERGTTDIPYGTCDADTPDGHFRFRDDSRYEFVNWSADDYIPDIGNGSSSFEVTPQEAIDHAYIESGDFADYLQTHSGAYVTNGYYNESGDSNNPKWNLTFGRPGDDTGHYIVVEESGGVLSVIEDDSVSLSELSFETEDFDPVLSFSGSEAVFRNDQDVNGAAFDGFEEVAFYDGWTYGTQADMIYPSISLTISLNIERTGYAYYLQFQNDEGSFMAGVDAISGQLMYVWDHKGDDLSAFTAP